MNRFVILVLVALAITLGYLLGTEQGRMQRDQLLEAINRLRSGEGGEGDIDLTAAADEAADTLVEA